MSAFLPELYNVDTSREMISAFRGYNHNLRISDDEFYDMKNMTGDYYPVLAPRRLRGNVSEMSGTPYGMFGYDTLYWWEGETFFRGIKNNQVPGDENTSALGWERVIKGEESEKQIVAMGNYVVIFPDKKCYNILTGEIDYLEQNHEAANATLSLCKLDGTPYGNYTVATKAPEAPGDGALWIDSSKEPHVLKEYSSATEEWNSVATTYVKISAGGIDTGFSELDGVTLTFKDESGAEVLSGEYIIYGVGEHYIIVTAIIDKTYSKGTASVSRKVPDMDFVTVCDNRLWGCSSAKNEIYACALGDPKNWNRFLGISTDSYAASIGSPGDFTGAITHMGYVLFMKEDCIHRIYGNRPANFQLTTLNCRGVEKGSERSLVIVNETLFYKSRHDICMLGSGLPVSISEPLGNIKYHSASAGQHNSKYYISMKDNDDNGVMLVYDTVKGMWHKEDDIYASYFASVDGELYFVNDEPRKGTNYRTIYSVGGHLKNFALSAETEQSFEWYVQTGDIGMDSPDKKYISKLQIRLDVAENALVKIDVQYDNESMWQEKFRINPTKKQSFTVPIIPRRCDTMRLRISGKGECRIYSVAKTVGQGSGA